MWACDVTRIVILRGYEARIFMHTSLPACILILIKNGDYGDSLDRRRLKAEIFEAFVSSFKEINGKMPR